MLLFSTVLEINDTMTKDNFIKLVIEWNQGSLHMNTVIPNIEWNGERNIRYGDDKLWMDIEEYRNKNIIAVRYEKREEDGVIWDTDYVMNFTTMKMSVRLERSYLEEALAIDHKFSTPYFISLLIDRGYIKKDNKLEVKRKPTMINENNIDLLVDVINGNSRYKIPVVFISKTFYDENPVNISTLANRLKGVVHVLVQESNCLNMQLRKLCAQKNEYYGAIGIYYPNHSVGHKRYLYRASDGIDRILSEKVVRAVIQYSNSQMVDMLYTWFGVNNALLQDRLNYQRQEYATAESERKSALYELLTIKENLDQREESMIKRAREEADKLLENFDEETQKRDDEIDRLRRELEKKEYEIMGLRAKIDSMTEVPLIYMGEEDDFYTGEIKDFVLSAVKKELNGTEPKTRRYDVLKDVLKANSYQEINEQRAAEAKKLLSKYSGMTPKLKRGLENIGFVFDHADHQKVKYYGDDRYTVIYASTPSDKGRSGKNNASTTVKKAF